MLTDLQKQNLGEDIAGTGAQFGGHVPQAQTSTAVSAAAGTILIKHAQLQLNAYHDFAIHKVLQYSTVHFYNRYTFNHAVVSGVLT